MQGEQYQLKTPTLAIMAQPEGKRFPITVQQDAVVPAVDDSTQGRPRRGPALTPRQLEVALLVAEGLSAKDVGARLGISCKTVEFHRQEAFKAVGAKNSVVLTRYLIREGLLNP